MNWPINSSNQLSDSILGSMTEIAQEIQRHTKQKEQTPPRITLFAIPPANPPLAKLTRLPKLFSMIVHVMYNKKGKIHRNNNHLTTHHIMQL